MVKTEIVLKLPPEELFWLQRLQALTGDQPARIIASMLRMIRIDDERAHHEDHQRH